MYTPRFNQVADRAVLLEAMRAYSFAILIGPLDETIGTSQHHATHLPLVVKDEGPHGIIEGHFAKENPHWQSLANRETLVVFPGPHSYVSPSLYAEQISVPTWNYIAVHAYGTLQLFEEEAAKEGLLFDLIEANEPAYADKWRAMPGDYRRKLLGGIVGFRISITRIEGKFKLSQNRSEADRSGVYNAHVSGSDDQRALADWMKRLIG
ncbi:MAG: FMN-binding negative transcriptional regulator [Acidobacteria bacterium]|nr:FMN-binding negative transcriptional regulator [Acidobacteriota bacterium]